MLHICTAQAVSSYRGSACRRAVRRWYDDTRSDVGVHLCNESAQSSDNFVVAQMESRQEVDCGAELPSMLPTGPDKVSVPLEISVIVALLACYLGIDVNRFVNEPVRARAAGGTYVKCDLASRGSIRSRYVLLRRDGIRPLRACCVALAHPAEAESHREPRSELAVKPAY